MTLFTSNEEPLLTGTDADVQTFIDGDRCIVLDWRGEEEDALWNVQQCLPNGTFFYEIAPENSAGEITITVRFAGREDTFTLPPRPQNLFRTLLRANRILTPEYEIKLFRATEGDDTHGFLLRSAGWWTAFRAAYPARYTAIFSDIETLTRLWELEAPPAPPPAPVPEKPKLPWWKRW